MRALLALALLSTVVACGDAPSQEQCAKLLDHLIELEIKAGGGSGEMTEEMKADLDKQRKAIAEFAQGEGKAFMSTCTSKTPKSVVECGLAAKSREDVAKCDEK